MAEKQKSTPQTALMPRLADDRPNPSTAYAHYVAAKACLARYDYEQAFGYAQAACELNHSVGEHWLVLAAVLEKVAALDEGSDDAGLWGEISAALTKAVAYNPHLLDAWLWLRLGTAYRMSFEFNRALECYAKALELAPEQPKSRQDKALVVKALEGTGTSLMWLSNNRCGEVFERILQLDPENLLPGMYSHGK